MLQGGPVELILVHIALRFEKISLTGPPCTPVNTIPRKFKKTPRHFQSICSLKWANIAPRQKIAPFVRLCKLSLVTIITYSIPRTGGKHQRDYSPSLSLSLSLPPSLSLSLASN